MATLYLDPVSDGSPFQWNGSYLDVDGGNRSGGGSTSSGSIQSYSEGDQAVINYGLPGSTSDTISAITVWAYVDGADGRPSVDLYINSWQGQRTNSARSSSVGGWSGWEYSYSGTFSSVTGLKSKHVCSSEEDDDIADVYLEITYEAASSSWPIAAAVVATQQVIIPPPIFGGAT